MLYTYKCRPTLYTFVKFALTIIPSMEGSISVYALQLGQEITDINLSILYTLINYCGCGSVFRGTYVNGTCL